MSEEEETSNKLETLTAKIDELSREIKEKKEYTEQKIKEKKEYTEQKIRENPLAYVAGAFAGGLIVGHLMARGKN